MADWDEENPLSIIRRRGFPAGFGGIVPTPDSNAGVEQSPVAAPQTNHPPALPAIQTQTPEEKDMAQHEAERQRLQSTGSGLMQFQQRHPILGGVLKGLDVAGQILAPRVESVIPGTEGNHRRLLGQENAAIGQDLGQQEKETEIAGKRAGTAKAEAETQIMGESVPVQTADGRTIYIPKKEFAKYEEGMNSVTGRQNVANTNVQGKKDIETMREMIAEGKVSRVMPVEENGQTVMVGYNGQGQEVHRFSGALPPSGYLPKSTSTTQYMQDADGNIVGVPKTSTSAPIIPQGGGGTVMPNAGATHSAQPGATHVMHGGTQSHTVLDANGQPLQGKGAHEQQAKVESVNTTAEVFKNYQDDFNKLEAQLTPKDRDAMRILINQAPATSGFVESLPIAGPIAGAVNGLLGGTITSDQYKAMSPAAKTLFLDYYNALAQHFVFLKNTQGSVPRNPQMIMAEMHTVPLPYIEKQSANEALDQYRHRIGGQVKAFGGHKSEGGGNRIVVSDEDLAK